MSYNILYQYKKEDKNMVKVLKGSMVAFLMLGLNIHALEMNDIKIQNSKSQKVNLDGYKTYQITKDSGIISRLNAKETTVKMDVNLEIQRIINNELAKKGKILVKENPDFLIAYSAGRDIEKDENATEKPESAMALVLIDAETGVVIGKSTAEADAKGLDDDSLTKRLEYAIKKMLSNI